MRIIILGLSCSLTACLEKQPTSSNEHLHGNTLEKETHANDPAVEENQETKESDPHEKVSRFRAKGKMDAGEGAKAKSTKEPIQLGKKKSGAISVRSAKKTQKPARSLNVQFGGLTKAEEGQLDSGSLGLSGKGIGGGGLNIGGVGRKGIASRGLSSGSAVYSEPTYTSYIVPNTEQYTDHGVNKFVQTSKDAHSTFSIDVDTASYTIARKKVNSGMMPPISSVRAEEFVNYFSYGYTTPKKDVFHIDMKAFSDPLRSDHTYLRVGLKAKEYTQKTRPPLNLSFLIDVSGSMSRADKLPLAQKSLTMLLESLRPDDTVSISTYAGRTALILPATKGNNKKAITKAIAQMQAGGSTAMSSGIDLAYEQVWKNFDPKKENRVVVLSDGDANVGRIQHSALLQQIKSYADRGVTLSTIGFGMGNYKDTRMEQLANKGDGNYYYIDTEKEGRKVFVEGFNSTMISVARDVKLQVEFDPNVVSSYRLIGYENRDIADKDFRNDTVDAGEVGAGHSVTALYEIKYTGHDGPLATTRLRYEPPGKDTVATERVYQLSSAKIQKKPSKDLILAYTAATFAEVLRKSPYVHDVSLSSLYDLAMQKKLSVDLGNTIKKSMEVETATASIK